MSDLALSRRLPVPVTRPTRVPAVTRPPVADPDRRRDAAAAYTAALRPAGPQEAGPHRTSLRGRTVDLLA